MIHQILSTVGNQQDSSVAAKTLMGILSNADYGNGAPVQITMNGPGPGTLLNVTGRGYLCWIYMFSNDFTGTITVDGTSIPFSTTGSEVMFKGGGYSSGLPYLFIPFNASLTINLTSGAPYGAFAYCLI